jgi:hypothetical protein
VRRRDRYPGPPSDLPPATGSVGPASQLDERLQEELRALGYVE